MTLTTEPGLIESEVAETGPVRTSLLFWIGLIVAVGVPVYLVTHYLMDNYNLADSFFYTKFWQQTKDVVSPSGLADLNETQVLTLGSQDPGYTLLLWLATRLDWTREQFLALANAVACTLVAGLVYRKPSSLLIIYSLLIYGYYIPAMMLTPERLRFSIYFGGLAIFFWLHRRRLLAIVLGVFSLLIHAQVVILYTAIGAYTYFPFFVDAFQTFVSRGVVRRAIVGLVVVGLIGALWLLNVNPQIQYKLSLYFEESIDPKVILAFVLVFALRFFVYRGSAFVFASLAALALSFAAAGTYLDRTLVNIYILYIYDFLTAPVRKPIMWLTFSGIFAWTMVKSIGFLASVQAGLGGYR